jgi:actin-related protein 2
MKKSQNHIQYDKVVCDNGTGYLKMGYAGDSFPRYSIPSIVGRPMLRSDQKIGDLELKDIMIGEEASPYRALLDIKYPIAEGRIQNWEDFSKLWDYTFNKRMAIKDIKASKILVTEAALNPQKNRDKMAELVVESYV